VDIDEDKYIVIPTKYIEQLSQSVRLNLLYALDRIRLMRERDGKIEPAKYYVVKQDEPYAESVRSTILINEERKQRGRWE
jgi:hypothetical protein